MPAIDNNELTGTTPRRKPKADVTQIGGFSEPSDSIGS
jgi:hypothetical protein